MHPYVHCSIIYSSQDMETTFGHINRWMDKEDVIHTHTHTHTHTRLEYYSTIKKEWNLAICNNMDGPRGYSHWNVRERQILYDITYMWNLKNKTNEHNRNSHRYREQTDGCQRGWGEWRREVREIKRYKLKVKKYMSHTYEI